MYLSASSEQSTSSTVKRYLRSIYFSPELGTTLFALESFSEENINTLRSIIDGHKTHCVFFPIRSMKSLELLSITDKELWYLNADSNASRQDTIQLGNEYFELFKTNILVGFAQGDYNGNLYAIGIASNGNAAGTFQLSQ
jgi:hypothetical protein